MYDMTI